MQGWGSPHGSILKIIRKHRERDSFLSVFKRRVHAYISRQCLQYVSVVAVSSGSNSSSVFLFLPPTLPSPPSSQPGYRIRNVGRSNERTDRETDRRTQVQTNSAPAMGMSLQWCIPKLLKKVSRYKGFLRGCVYIATSKPPCGRPRTHPLSLSPQQRAAPANLSLRAGVRND